jgi:hypothetical protein
VQGTIYHVNVMDERSTVIQVYEGAVNIYNPFPPAPKPSSDGSTTPFSEPRQVVGPVAVEGPKAVSREEWTQIILHESQQVTVTDRDISQPVSFNIDQERKNEWIKWNEERDSDFQPPERPR